MSLLNADSPLILLKHLAAADKIVLAFGHGDWHRAKSEVYAFVDSNTTVAFTVMLGRENAPYFTDTACEIVVRIKGDDKLIDALLEKFNVIEIVRGN